MVRASTRSWEGPWFKPRSGLSFLPLVFQQVIISEHAEFDERVFPGLSTKGTTPPALLQLLETQSHSQLAPSDSGPLPSLPDTPGLVPAPLLRPGIIPAPPAPSTVTSPAHSPAASSVPAPFIQLPPQPPAIPQPVPLLPAPPAPLALPAPPVAPRRSTREVKKPGEWWKVTKPVQHVPAPYYVPARLPAPVRAPAPIVRIR